MTRVLSLFEFVNRDRLIRSFRSNGPRLLTKDGGKKTKFSQVRDRLYPWIHPKGSQSRVSQRISNDYSIFSPLLSSFLRGPFFDVGLDGWILWRCCCCCCCCNPRIFFLAYDFCTGFSHTMDRQLNPNRRRLFFLFKHFSLSPISITVYLLRGRRRMTRRRKVRPGDRGPFRVCEGAHGLHRGN